jgi:hypothetical protein
MTYPVKPNRLAGFPEPLSPRAVDRKHNLRSANTIDPFFFRNRQAKLILENTLAVARDSIRSATDLVTRRAGATPDPFLRHHLLATAREVAAIEGVLEASLWPDEPGPPCLVRTLMSEIYKLERIYEGRIGPIDRRMAIQNFTPSWMAEIIFRLISRAIIYDAFINAPRNGRLSLQLWLVNEMICLTVDGAGYCTEQALLLRIERPKHFKLLLHSLSGSFAGRPNGISIRIPVAACTPSEATDEVTLCWPVGKGP